MDNYILFVFAVKALESGNFDPQVEEALVGVITALLRSAIEEAP